MPSTVERDLAVRLLEDDRFASLTATEVAALAESLTPIVQSMNGASTPVYECAHLGVVDYRDADDVDFMADFTEEPGNDMFVKVGDAMPNQKVNTFRARLNYQAKQNGTKINTHRYGPLYHVKVV